MEIFLCKFFSVLKNIRDMWQWQKYLAEFGILPWISQENNNAYGSLNFINKISAVWEIGFYWKVIVSTVMPRFISPRCKMSNFLLPLTSICVVIRFTVPFFDTNCDENRGITVNSYNFFKFLVKNILLCSMSNMEFDLRLLRFF